MIYILLEGYYMYIKYINIFVYYFLIYSLIDSFFKLVYSYDIDFSR